MRQALAHRWRCGMRGWWPDGNPLRRRSDRAEAAVFAVLVAVFLAGAPLLALIGGELAHHGGRHGQAFLAGMLAVLMLAELLYGIGVVAHSFFERRRMAAWDIAWRATAPKWRRHA
jgi:hypothetical protein